MHHPRLNIDLRLFQIADQDGYDKAILVSGDSDLPEAARQNIERYIKATQSGTSGRKAGKEMRSIESAADSAVQGRGRRL